MSRINTTVFVSAVIAVVLLGAGVFAVTQPVWGGVATSPPSTLAQSAHLEKDVRKLVSDFLPRDYTHPDNLDRAAAYIRGELEAAGGLVQEQPYDVRGTTYRNVTALFGPSTPERIVVGAHYDVCDQLPGADDNASGVAGLLELARMLGGARLTKQVELVAYSLEEPPFFRTGYMGSAVHASSLRERNIGVVAMFSLEMLGYYSDAPDSQQYPIAGMGLLYPRTGNFISVIGRFGEGMLVRRVKQAMREATDLPVHSSNAFRWIPGIDFSDHANYWDSGFPAVMITDTASNRNENYHTAFDTPDTLDYRRMAKAVTGVYRAVLVLSSN